MQTGLKVKNFFFDRKAIIEALGRAEAMALAKVGAFIQRRAKSSIRKRPKVSAPGSPPSSHEGSLRNRIYFSYDPSSRSVVIGPVKFKSGNAPQLLEFGGRGTVVTKRGAMPAIYKPRPYMGPAVEAEVASGTIPSRWANSIRR